MPAHAARLVIALGLLLVVGLAALAQPGGPPPPATPRPTPGDMTIEHFMTGLACIESSGRYSAVNSDSGAIGKYQIMPRNWRVWSGRFLGDETAEPTPQNQEIVARTRIERLIENRGTWRRVAYWWLTGRSIDDERLWTDKARGYVDRVMEVAERAATPALAGSVPEQCRPVVPDEVLLRRG